MNTASIHTENVYACVLRGKIYVVGEIDVDENVVNKIECYNPVNDA